MTDRRYKLEDAAKLTGYSKDYLRKLARCGALKTEQRGQRAHHFVTSSELRRAFGATGTDKNGTERESSK